jgi:hypothetical protein
LLLVEQLDDWNVALVAPRAARVLYGAHEWNRTIDLLLTKEVLYRLSYVSDEMCLYYEKSMFKAAMSQRQQHSEQQWSGRRESNPH